MPDPIPTQRVEVAVQPPPLDPERQALVALAMQVSPQGMLIVSRAAEGPFFYANEAFNTITGYTLSDVPTVEEWDRRAYPDPDYRAWVQVDRLQITPSVYRVYRVRCADGRDKNILFNRGWLPEHRMVVTLMDVDEHSRVMRNLQESEERLRRLSDSLPVGVVVHSLGRIMYANVAAARMAGVDRPQDLLDRDVFSFVHPASLEVTRERIAALYRKEHDAGWIESLFADAGGDPLPVEVTSLRVDWMGKPAGMVIFNDIRARKEAEAERRRLEQRIQDAQRMESLALLAGGVAHDFNNLIVGILGNADLALLDLPPDSPARAWIEGIELAGRRAAELARQMLAYSGRGKFVVDRFDLGALIRETAHLMEASISKKAILEYDFAANLPAVRGDATQVRQVVMNLVTNASEALSEQGGTIRVSTGTLEIREGERGFELMAGMAPCPGPYVWLEVSDSGCGMDEPTRARIFEPFFTTKFTGRGLGLAAVQGIVRGHRGVIGVSSAPGKGSAFKVLFPATDAVHESRGELPVGPHDEARRTGRVLVVDDEPMVRGACAQMLLAMGYEVTTAADGRSAIDIFSQDSAFDVVLLDLSMPAMDGQETFTALRRIRSDIRVVLSSGYHEQEAIIRFDGTGLAGFLQKPYRVSDLVDALERAMGSGG